MKYNEPQSESTITPDYGFDSPHKSKAKCKNPEFANHYLHRLAIIKEEHFGAKGDRDENGLPGWVSKRICVGCSKEFKKKRKTFHPD